MLSRPIGRHMSIQPHSSTCTHIHLQLVFRDLFAGLWVQRPFPGQDMQQTCTYVCLYSSTANACRQGWWPLPLFVASVTAVSRTLRRHKCTNQMHEHSTHSSGLMSECGCILARQDTQQHRSRTKAWIHAMHSSSKTVSSFSHWRDTCHVNAVASAIYQV